MLRRIPQKPTRLPTSPHKSPLPSNLAVWNSSSSEAESRDHCASFKRCHCSRQAIGKNDFNNFQNQFSLLVWLRRALAQRAFQCLGGMRYFFVSHYLDNICVKSCRSHLQADTAFGACRFPATQHAGMMPDGSRFAPCQSGRRRVSPFALQKQCFFRGAKDDSFKPRAIRR